MDLNNWYEKQKEQLLTCLKNGYVESATSELQLFDIRYENLEFIISIEVKERK